MGSGHFYLARQARFVGQVESDDLEEQETLLLTRAEIADALLRGEFRLMPWMAAMALALHRLNALASPESQARAARR
jgi:ADP-ribose pyrophosphatase